MKTQNLVPLGQVMATPGVLRAFEACRDIPERYLRRHMRQDWGIVDEEDQAANDWALKNGSRILSAYLLKDETKIWVITEADRSATTILLPEEY